VFASNLFAYIVLILLVGRVTKCCHCFSTVDSEVVMVVCGAVGVSRRHTMAASVHVHPGPAADMAQLTLHDQDSDSDVTDNATIALGTSPTPAVAAAGMLITLSLTRLLFCLFIYLSKCNIQCSQ